MPILVTFDPGETAYQGVVYQLSPTTLECIVHGSVAALGSDPSFAVGVGDTLTLDLRVELA